MIILFITNMHHNINGVNNYINNIEFTCFWIIMILTYVLIISLYILLFNLLTLDEILNYLYDISIMIGISIVYKPWNVWNGFLYSLQNYKLFLVINLILTYLNSSLFQTVISFIVFNGFVSEIMDI